MSQFHGIAHFALAVVLLAVPAFAAATVVVTPSRIPGVEVLAPGTSEFDVALSTLLAGQPRTALTPSLPYSVIIRNSSPQTVCVMGVLFLVQSSPTSTPSGFLKRTGSVDTLAGRRGLRPGGIRFVSLSNAENAVNGRLLPAYATSSSGASVAQQSSAELDRSHSVTVTLDFVIFSDGSFVGPDEAMLSRLSSFDKFRQEVAAEYAVARGIAELKGHRTEEITTYLKRSSEQSVAAYDMYTRAVARRARAALSALNAQGAPAILQQAADRIVFLSAMPQLIRRNYK